MSAELEAWRIAHYVPEITAETTTAEILTLAGQMDNAPDLNLYLIMQAREESP